MLSRTEPHWYVIQSKPRQERRALEHLERQGYSCYLPVLTRECVRHGVKVGSSEPLFPRYFFIQLHDTESNWYPIRSTRGVHQLVTCDQRPVAVRDELIAGIRARLMASGTVPYLKPGESVCITEGPFSQLEAIFIANDGDERVVLLLNLLQKDQRLSFPITSVRKLA